MRPLLESDELICPHQGTVQLKSDKGKALLSDNSGVITASDLMQSSITGCVHSVLGVPRPCSVIVQIPPASLSESLEINGDKAVLADNVGMILTDNGVPVRLSMEQEKLIEIDK